MSSSKKWIAGAVALASVLTASLSYSDALTLKDLAPIKADSTHQTDYFDPHKALIYEIPGGKGFILDTSEYKEFYEKPEENTFFVSTTKSIRVDRVGSSRDTVSISLAPGQDLYPICPPNGLRPGDKFNVSLLEEVYDWGHYNYSYRWEASIRVQ